VIADGFADVVRIEHYALQHRSGAKHP